MNSLSPRLRAIVSLVDPVEVICDLGCDHGYVSARLLKDELVDYVIATDISRPSLNKANHLLNALFSKDQFELRYGDGLSVLDQHSVDSIIIAGMGGDLIRSIIESDWKLIKDLDYLIVQPMQKQGELFQWLAKASFKLLDSRLVKEGHRYYPIVKIKYSTSREVYSPEWFKQSKNYKPFLTDQLNHYKEIANRIKKNSLDYQSYEHILKKIDYWEEYYDKA